jgi:hypothetical protein
MPTTLRCNFPEADIRAGAQHFATLDDCNADEAPFRCSRPNDRFDLTNPRDQYLYPALLSASRRLGQCG